MIEVVRRVVKVVIDLPEEVLEDLLTRVFKIDSIKVQENTLQITVMYRHYILKKKRKREEQNEEGGEWIADKITLEGVI